MIILEQNLLKLNNGQFAKFSHLDDWHRMIFTFEDGKNYCLLDEEIFYSITSDFGEPNRILRKEWQPKNIKLFESADKNTQSVISVDEWEEYFEPVVYEDDEDHKLFEYEEVVEYVKKHILEIPYDDWNGVDETFYNKPYQHIWSVLHGDNEKLILLNGYHKVNVLHYIVCKTPWGTGSDTDKNNYLEVAYED